MPTILEERVRCPRCRDSFQRKHGRRAGTGTRELRLGKRLLLSRRKQKRVKRYRDCVILGYRSVLSRHQKILDDYRTPSKRQYARSNLQELKNLVVDAKDDLGLILAKHGIELNDSERLNEAFPLLVEAFHRHNDPGLVRWLVCVGIELKYFNWMIEFLKCLDEAHWRSGSYFVDPTFIHPKFVVFKYPENDSQPFDGYLKALEDVRLTKTKDPLTILAMILIKCRVYDVLKKEQVEANYAAFRKALGTHPINSPQHRLNNDELALIHIRHELQSIMEFHELRQQIQSFFELCCSCTPQLLAFIDPTFPITRLIERIWEAQSETDQTDFTGDVRDDLRQACAEGAYATFLRQFHIVFKRTPLLADFAHDHLVNFVGNRYGMPKEECEGSDIEGDGTIEFDAFLSDESSLYRWTDGSETSV